MLRRNYSLDYKSKKTCMRMPLKVSWQKIQPLPTKVLGALALALAWCVVPIEGFSNVSSTKKSGAQ